MSTAPDEPMTSLADMQAHVDALAEEATTLDAAIASEIADAPRAPWSAALEALAADIMPLSRTDASCSPFERRLEALRRQRVRLQREGEALRARTEALRPQIAVIREHSATASEMAARARRWASEARRYRASMSRWTAELVEYRRRYAASPGEK